MSNSLIPMGPSNADIQEMARLRNILNGGSNVPAVANETVNAHYSGGYAGTQRPLNESRGYVAPAAPAYMPSFGTSRADVDAMKNIMETLNQLSGDEEAPRQQLQETSQFSSPALPAPQNGPYSVLAIIEESGGKDVNRYNVVDAGRRDVAPGMVMKEAATAVMKLLNKGQSVSSPKVQEVLDLDEEFNRSRIETGRHKARYARSMELGESAAANVFKDRFNAARAQALAAQDTIKSINESLR